MDELGTSSADEEKRDQPDNDGREPWNFKTRYPLRAWAWISIEAVYLALLLLTLLFHFLFSMTVFATDTRNVYGSIMSNLAGPPDEKRYQYLVIALSGALGGTLFSIKWLIHSVAKGYWHEDRRLWRLFVPLTAGGISIVFAAIIQSGIIALFDSDSFQNLELAFAFGALVGYFADAVIGVMSNIAGVLFGTVKDRNDVST